MRKRIQGAFLGLAVFLGAGALVAFQTRTGTPALIVLSLSKSSPANAAAKAIPAGWQLKVNTGKPDVSADDPDDQAAIRFRSVKSSFSLERDVDVDPVQLPYLSWRWKVAQLPKGGDFRHYATDDQAAQLLVGFDGRHILTYIWDSSAPAGTMQSANSLPLMHIFAFVCRSGEAEANRWIQETRNIAADYQKAFGQKPPHVKGLRIQINSQHTGSTAESYFGEIEFLNAQS